MIPVLATKNLRGYPKHETGGRVRYRVVGDALLARYTTDAHFAVYSAPSVERRLTQDAPGMRDAFPDGVALVLATFDVDSEGSHKASGAKTPLPATDEWWLAEQAKIAALLSHHPGAFIYRTRGGYRLVWALVGAVLHDPSDAASWTARYVAWIAYLRRRFGVFADPSCADWTRLYRLPFVCRDGVAENRETIGDARAIGAWSCEPSTEDYEFAKTIKKQKKPRAFKPREERPAASVGDGVLFHAFKARGAIGPSVERGTWALQCPWESEHSKGETFDSSTVLFAPGSGEELGWPHCSHSHCATRSIGHWLALFTEDELDHARQTAGYPPRDAARSHPSPYVVGALANAVVRIERGDLVAFEREAQSIGRFVRAGHVREDLVRRALVDAATVAGLEHVQIERVFQMAFRRAS